jgi:hypothetical protein
MARNAVISKRDPATLQFRAKSCERKRWFRTRADADIVGSRFDQRAYHCRFCDGYHLTASHVRLAEQIE